MSQLNPSKLHAELQKAGIPIEGVSSDGRIDFLPTATEAQQAQAMQILAAHDPHDYVEDVRTGALTQAHAIPNWASWDEATMQAWFEENITSALASATTVAQVKAVLQSMAQAQQKVARMVIAMRNQLWPDLQQK